MRKQSVRSALVVVTCLAAAAATGPVLARPGGWGSPAWGGGMRPGPEPVGSGRPQRDRGNEGRITVNRFVAEGDAAAALGHGLIVVSSQSAGAEFSGPGDRAAFEAAVIDRLIKAGYDTATVRPAGGQIAELRVTRTVVEPAAPQRKPVSGEAALEVGNRGTAYGLAVNVDLSKPLPPLVSTRLEARIRDRVTSQVLWEGRATVATREGDGRWQDQDIAARLAEALFDGFPRAADSIDAPG